MSWPSGKVTPAITTSLKQVHEEQAIPVSSTSESPGFVGSQVTGSNPVRAGQFYQFEVKLSDFTAISTVTLPIRYDTDVLEPAAVVSRMGASYLNAASAAALQNAASGTNFAVPSADANRYGILPGMDFTRWKSGDTAANFSKPTVGGSYQYINTKTGLVKLEASITTPAPFGTGSNTQFVRLFFRAKKDAAYDGAAPPVWFATEDDCPESAQNSDTLKVTYYDPASPNGALATVGGANVAVGPPSLKDGAPCNEENPLTITAQQLTQLPVSYIGEVTAARLSANEVKIYNYTNYTPLGTGVGTLDFGIEDRLVIDESTFLRPDDGIRVYRFDGAGYELIAEGVVKGDASVDIALGTNKLSSAGGTLYVAVVKAGQESTKVAVPYAEEVSRDVTFRVCRSGWADDRAVTDLALNANLLNDVKLGEQIQIRIYFNNFYDLMSYGFALQFNPAVVAVADAEYHPMASGTVLEETYKAGGTAFSVGGDLSNVTLTEQVVYQAGMALKSAQELGDEQEIADAQAEISALMALLKLTDRADFDQMVADVSVKYSVGVSSGPLPWRGGLLFTGDEGREGHTTYPYIDNEGGLVQFMSASLSSPPLILAREGGYHFLTINFVAKSYGNPQFSFAAVGEEFEGALTNGKQVVLAGPSYEVGMTTHWEVAPMGSQPTVTLSGGNARVEDADDTAVFLYDGAAFRDPGFLAKRANGSTIPSTDVRRYYIDEAGDEVDLPPYASDEALTDFLVRGQDGVPQRSDHYELHYAYETPDTGKTADVVRNIYVIFRKGDVNRDGAIDVFDEQALTNHLNDTSPLDLTDPLYVGKTLDLDKNGTVNQTDLTLLHRHLMGLAELAQDYVMPVP